MTSESTLVVVMGSLELPAVRSLSGRDHGKSSDEVCVGEMCLQCVRKSRK